MSRSKTHGPESRALMAEIKRLKKKLKQFERESQILENTKRDDDDDEDVMPDKIKIQCPNCQEGTIAIMDLEIKVFEVCGLCGYRKLIRG